MERSVPIGLASGVLPAQLALAVAVGPLIEAPVLIGLVYVALWLQRRLFVGAKADAAQATG